MRRAAQAQSAADVHATEAAVATASSTCPSPESAPRFPGRASQTLVTVGNRLNRRRYPADDGGVADPMYVYFDADENGYLRQRNRSARTSAPRRTMPSTSVLPTKRLSARGRVDFLDTRSIRRSEPCALAPCSPIPTASLPRSLCARAVRQRPKAEALLIDDKAILTDQDRKYVYAVDSEGQGATWDVVLGGMVGGLRVVQSGLRRMTRIVVVGLQKSFTQACRSPPQGNADG